MASLLVAARDFFQHPDLVKRERASCKKGYIVMVRENNQSWGRQEGLPDFIQLTIPGSVVATKHLIARKEHINYIPTVDGIEEVTETDKKYSHIIPSSLVDIAITNGGKLTINPTQIVKL